MRPSWVLLGLAAFTGFSLGLTLPLLMSFLALSVPAAEGGMAIPLRQAADRLASAGIPVLMGLPAEGVGKGVSFLLSGGLLTAALVALSVGLRPALRAAGASVSG